MAEDLEVSREPFRESDRIALSEKLLAFLSEVERVLRSGFGEEAPGTRAYRLANGDFASSSQGTHPGRNALETALFAALAGVDHSRLMARSLPLNDAAFALATLTRGAVEAYARACWFLEPEADRDVIVRWLSGLAAEFSMAKQVRTNGTLHDIRGLHSTAEVELTGVLDDIERLTGSRAALRLSYTRMASSLLDRSKTDGRATYSQLSGAAHGESLALHGFVADDPGFYVIYLPERWGLSYASQVISATRITTQTILETLGRPSLESAALVATHDDVAAHVRSAVEKMESRQA